MDYLFYLGTLILIYGMFALAYSVLIGYTGMLSLSHAAYFGLGAYGYALARLSLHLSAPTAILFGIAIALFTSIICSPLLLRLRGDQYTLATISFNLLFFYAATNWASVTNGVYGLESIPTFSVGSIGTIVSTLIVAFLAELLCVGISKVLLSGHFGRVVALAREQEGVARMFGYRTTLYFFALATITAVIAGIAGAVYAGAVSYIDPNIFNLNESLLVLEAVIIGGVASAQGAFIGAGLVFVIPEILQFFGFPQETAPIVRSLVFGLVLIFLIRSNPKGIFGKFYL